MFNFFNKLKCNLPENKDIETMAFSNVCNGKSENALIYEIFQQRGIQKLKWDIQQYVIIKFRIKQRDC